MAILRLLVLLFSNCRFKHSIFYFKTKTSIYTQ
uniref:Uncharacterized protein n=1 Tax=Myoviridae sp. ctk251 TaxID=2826689 RepID=A0A8S5MT27_9CAUD|nr:MAG TPA: hypothetical protein [Myoviridae sp. ctk251]